MASGVTMSHTPSEPSKLAFSYRNFRFFWLTTLLVSFAVQIMSVSIAWQIYDVTGEPFLLGLVGLSLFLPALVLILVTGLTADRFNRRMIMAICLGVELLCALGFLAFVNAKAHEVWPIFGILIVLGTARAFWNPAAQSLAPNLVPPEALANAITTNMSAWQFASIAGPAAGGLLYGIAPSVAFGTGAVLLVIAMVSVLMISKPQQRESHQATSLETMLAGFRYIFSNKVVLGAISLDMFAVLMGGAVALLPIYAKDILHAGPQELGLLRAAPGVGAIAMALLLTRFPIRDHAGKLLFLFVGLFGAFHRAVRLVDHGVDFGACTGAGRRFGHGERHHPRDHHAAMDARRGARTGECGELGLHRRVQRAGRVPRRHGGASHRSGAGSGDRWGGAIAIAVIWSRLFPGLRTQRSAASTRIGWS
jgi:MFS family permease